MPSKLDLIRALLLSDWDPIGVSGCEGAENEYDRYALQVFNMLEDGAGAESIASYLTGVVTDRMSLAGRPEADHRIAARVLMIYQS
ncbi:hypothetical protein S58_66210 [Bradyrhizobium oligotrophicum S58]|uniref:DUF1871 family protein n=1 Tax=Bradyrhizobium oligotrophicum S58 TaxID=1245469 RepID=M4ZFK7_9BRAD|nr:hypothetical protein [Bradyrhizobium oligotrophicum]BAM92588.1 hypothetical protein S58_66210 [Bradyrhizobium oligotrophicum S58]